jgi:hypothetical protein
MPFSENLYAIAFQHQETQKIKVGQRGYRNQGLQQKPIARYTMTLGSTGTAINIRSSVQMQSKNKQ